MGLDWEQTEWKGLSAWASTRDGTRAIITETHSRLIEFGPSDGSLNLLNAPEPHVLPHDETQPPNLGGHRFWLGPQHRWGWPPPVDWEYASAQDVSANDGILTLRHSHVDIDYPAITRKYAWEGKRLRCTVQWQDDGTAYFGLHVVAVNTPFFVTAQLEKTKDVPAGLVVARIEKPEGPLHFPHPSITVDDESATVHGGIKSIKLGFWPQALTIERQHGWKLSVEPGPHTSATGELPDSGYLSQVWVGDDTHKLAELEQLTPYLKGDATGCCSSTIYLGAISPSVCPAATFKN